MIKGLYEAHLPVSDLNRSIEFYKKLGLELAYQYEKVAFFWIVPRQSWIGLWQTEIKKDREPASFPGYGRHIAFEVEFDNITIATEWLSERGIAVREHAGLEPVEPITRPHQKMLRCTSMTLTGMLLSLFVICRMVQQSLTG